MPAFSRSEPRYSLQQPTQLLGERGRVVVRRPFIGGEALVITGEDHGRDAQERGERIAASSSPPAPLAGRAAATSGRPTRRCATPNATSHSKRSAPTNAPSPTGRPARRVRARHRGAHLKGRQAAKQRGRRPSPSDLRFSSSVTRTHHDSATGGPPGPAHLTFMRRPFPASRPGS